MKILLNERTVEVPEGTTLFEVRRRWKPDADIVIFNGALLEEDRPLRDGDRVALIRRGEKPSGEELEALLMARHTPDVHERIKRSVVGIAGLGGLGSAVAAALARCGVGTLILADFDVVEPSNLNRQYYFIDQIGLPKTEALAATIRRIHPGVRCVLHGGRITADNAAEIFREADVVVEAFDRPEEKAMLVGSLPDKPIVAASGVAGYGPCSQLRVHRPGGRLFVVGDLESAAEPGRGLMAPRVGCAAHMQANLVLRILLGEEAV